MDIGSIGVRRGGGEVADHGEPGVLHAHVGIVLGPFLGVDGVLPAGLLEGLLPVVHAGDQVRAPLLRGGRVDVVDDGLDRLHELAPLLLLHVLRTGFKAPAGDEADAFHGLLLVGELRVAVGKVTDAGVEPARLHGLFGQEDHRGVEHERHDAGLGAGGQRIGPGGGAVRGGRGRVIGEGLGGRHLGVDGVGADALDEGGVALEAAQVIGALGGRGERERHVVPFEQGRHLHAGAAGGSRLLGLQRGHDRVLRAGLHGEVDVVAVLGMDDVRVDAQEKVAVHGFLPVDHAVGDHFSAIFVGAGGMLHEAGDGEDPAAEEAVRNVEVPVLLVLGHAEQAGGDLQLGRRFLGFFLVFLLGVGFGARTGTGTLGQGSRGERDHEGHGGDEDLFHRYLFVVDSYEDSHFSRKAVSVRLISARKSVFLNDYPIDLCIFRRFSSLRRLSRSFPSPVARKSIP